MSLDNIRMPTAPTSATSTTGSEARDAAIRAAATSEAELIPDTATEQQSRLGAIKRKADFRDHAAGLDAGMAGPRRPVSAGAGGINPRRPDRPPPSKRAPPISSEGLQPDAKIQRDSDANDKFGPTS